MKTITTNELKDKIDTGDNFHLIDVLSDQSYQEHHLPTAINIPQSPELPKQVEDMGIAKDEEIIVYCGSVTCMASPTMAKALESAGFSNVVDYEDGLAGWQDAGQEFETAG
ncbi:MAG: rhodanese-like domain-containing protein [Candidatus Saccharimonadales bacterium]